MRSIDLSHPLNRLARMLGSISVRTRMSWHSSRLQAFSTMPSPDRRSTDLGDSVNS
jgi:hypothetical protein